MIVKGERVSVLRANIVKRYSRCLWRAFGVWSIDSAVHWISERGRGARMIEHAGLLSSSSAFMSISLLVCLGIDAESVLVVVIGVVVVVNVVALQGTRATTTRTATGPRVRGCGCYKPYTNTAVPVPSPAAVRGSGPYL